MNKSGQKPDYKEGVLFKIKVDLEPSAWRLWFFHLRERGFPAGEILLSPRDSSRPERLFSTKEIVLLIAKRKRKYLGKTKTAKGGATSYQEEHKKSMIQCTAA